MLVAETWLAAVVLALLPLLTTERSVSRGSRSIDGQTDDNIVSDYAASGEFVHRRHHRPHIDLQTCVQTCAECVRHWQHGLYNGKRCANRCLRNHRKIPDPDCDNPKMLNYSPQVIRMLLDARNERRLNPDEADESLRLNGPGEYLVYNGNGNFTKIVSGVNQPQTSSPLWERQKAAIRRNVLRLARRKQVSTTKAPAADQEEAPAID